MDMLIPPQSVVSINLTGRQCRTISFAFTDFLDAVKIFKEFPAEVIIAARSILSWSRGYAEKEHNGSEFYDIKIPKYQADLIALALTYETMRNRIGQQDIELILIAISRQVKMGEKS